MSEPWDRWPKEQAKPYGKFRVYLEMGPMRSLHRLYLKLTDTGQKCSEGSLWWTCKKWQWVKRCEAWDAHLQRQNQLAFEREAEEMGRMQARAGRFLFEKGLARLGDDMQPTAQLTTREAIQLVVEGIRVERLARGEATSRVDMKVVNEVVEKVAKRLNRPFLDVMAEVEDLVKGLV